MLSSLDPATMSFLSGLNQIQRRIQTSQAQLTTGLKLNSVADDPSQMSLLYQTQSNLAHTQQITSNLNNVQAEVNSGETSLQSAVTLMEQVQSLASQAQTGFASADTRTQIAAQLGDDLTALVSIANTTQGGRYIFSGDSDQTPPYSIDLTQPSPVSAYAGSGSTRQVESPDANTFAVAKTAQDIFDSSDPTTNIFQNIVNLRSALLNNDQAGIDAVVPNLQSCDSHLNQQLAFYGVTQNQVTNGLNTAANLTTQLQTQLSGIQDADMTQAITNFQLAQTQEQAALTSWSKLPRTTLFDYLG